MSSIIIYRATLDSFHISPTQKTTTLTLNVPAAVPWGGTLAIKGKLTNSISGAGIGGKNITISTREKSILRSVEVVVTDPDGSFTTNGTANKTVGTGWMVAAHFAGDA